MGDHLIAVEEDVAIELGLGTTTVAESDEHEAHVFLYVPDMANRTGWSTHRVPERQPERRDRRPMGFARGGR